MHKNEFSETVYFENIQEVLPEYFTSQDISNIENALYKWNNTKDTKKSPKEVFKQEKFTYEEISGFALWKASIFYAHCPAQVKGTEEKVFLSILNKFTQHYLDLAGKR